MKFLLRLVLMQARTILERMVGEKAGSVTVLTFAIDGLAIEKTVSNVEGREVAVLIPNHVQNKLPAKLR